MIASSVLGQDNDVGVIDCDPRGGAVLANPRGRGPEDVKLC